MKTNHYKLNNKPPVGSVVVVQWLEHMQHYRNVSGLTQTGGLCCMLCPPLEPHFLTNSFPKKTQPMPTNISCSNPKNIQFTIMYDKEKHQIFTFEKLKSEKF